MIATLAAALLIHATESPIRYAHFDETTEQMGRSDALLGPRSTRVQDRLVAELPLFQYGIHGYDLLVSEFDSLVLFDFVAGPERRGQSLLYDVNVVSPPEHAGAKVFELSFENAEADLEAFTSVGHELFQGRRLGLMRWADPAPNSIGWLSQLRLTADADAHFYGLFMPSGRGGEHLRRWSSHPLEVIARSIDWSDPWTALSGASLMTLVRFRSAEPPNAARLTMLSDVMDEAAVKIPSDQRVIVDLVRVTLAWELFLIDRSSKTHDARSSLLGNSLQDLIESLSTGSTDVLSGRTSTSISSVLDFISGQVDVRVNSPVVARKLLNNMSQWGDNSSLKVWTLGRLDVSVHECKPILLDLLNENDRSVNVVAASYLQRTEPEERRWPQPVGPIQRMTSEMLSNQPTVPPIVAHWRAELSRDSTKRE